MDSITFWQTIGAVIVANHLFAAFWYLVWRVTKQEKGEGTAPPLWLFPLAICAPAVVMVAIATLP